MNVGERYKMFAREGQRMITLVHDEQLLMQVFSGFGCQMKYGTRFFHGDEMTYRKTDPLSVTDEMIDTWRAWATTNNKLFILNGKSKDDIQVFIRIRSLR